MRVFVSSLAVFSMLALGVSSGAAQTTAPQQPQPKPSGAPSTPAQGKPAGPAKPSGTAGKPTTPPAGMPASIPLPADYVIGPDDVLAVLYWREKDMSVDQTIVRPDGMITLPILNDVKAAGLTPEQLRDQISQAASKYVEDPNVTIVVKQINSRRVFVTGQVTKGGAFPLTSPTTVMQAIAMAGGLSEYAKASDIVVMRTVNGKTQRLKFNYKDVIKGKKLEQNVELRPGDTVVVP